MFDDGGSGRSVKNMAGCHQSHAVRVAVGETLRAAELAQEGKRIGEEEGHYESGRRRAAMRATGASGWSGTPRGRARA